MKRRLKLLLTAANLKSVGNTMVLAGVLLSLFTSIDGATLVYVMVGGLALAGVGWIIQKTT